MMTHGEARRLLASAFAGAQRASTPVELQAAQAIWLLDSAYGGFPSELGAVMLLSRIYGTPSAPQAMAEGKAEMIAYHLWAGGWPMDDDLAYARRIADNSRLIAGALGEPVRVTFEGQTGPPIAPTPTGLPPGVPTDAPHVETDAGAVMAGLAIAGLAGWILTRVVRRGRS
jgi:hypothetical protein